MRPRADRLARTLRAIGRVSLIFAPVAVLVLSTVAGTIDGHVEVTGLHAATSTLLIAIAALIAFIALAADAQRERHWRELAASHDDLMHRADAGETTILDLLRVELRALEDAAGYMSNERISLFRREDDQLILLARRSKRPAFDETPGRARIPLEQGCAGRAWSEGSAYEPGLPDPGPDTGPPSREWVGGQEERWQVPAGVAEQLKMRSQMYAAFRLETATEPVGVIVFESTVSVNEHAAVGSGAPHMPGPEELGRLVKDAGQRLCKLVLASYVMPGERVVERLAAQQGSGRLRAGAQSEAAAATRRSSS